MKFKLGQVVATPAALEKLQEAGQSASEFIDRHVQGDWGDLTEDDRQANNEGIMKGKEDRLLSAYSLKTGVKIWIITEWDRSVTTVLLPDDY